MIEFKNVSKRYDNGTEALKNVNLRIERGEFVFIVGASGSGKSTFLKTIMREEVPTSGTIMINNYDLTQMTNKEIPYFRRTMGIVFQDFRLIPTMSVYDNVAFAMRVIGASEKDIRKRVPYVLSLVGLQNKARSMPNEISGGEQQRVALARALVNNANTIIADEPTGNIDPEMSYEIIDLLNHINENGTTIIMVTHEHDLVKKFNHRIVVIDHGEVVSDTAAGDVLRYQTETGYKPVQTAPSAQTQLRQASVGMDENQPNIQVVNVPAAALGIAEPVAAEPTADNDTIAGVQAAVANIMNAPAAQPPVDEQSVEQPVVQEAPAQVQTAMQGQPAQQTIPAQGAPVMPITGTPVASPVATPVGSPLSATSRPEPTPAPVQNDAPTVNSYTTIDGIDYSKYFEDIDELLGKGGSK